MTSLPPIPPRMFKLPRFRVMGMDAPVPWFVQWLDEHGQPCEVGKGEPDFRIMDADKLQRAIRFGNCWVCGEKVGAYKAFVIGPMCTINRVTAEPPSHSDCALFSVHACPFLTRPRMRRDRKDMPEHHQSPGGIMLERNPGVSCIWITKSFTIIRSGGILFKIGDPTSVFWFAEGKPATRDQVMASIDSGYPLLLDLAEKEGLDAVRELTRYRERAQTFLPRVTV